MIHEAQILALFAAAFVCALLLGWLAVAVRLPPLVGYLLAGIVIGPFTPGIHGNSDLAQEFSEVGVILLMFGVGLHFSVEELWRHRRLALPGAVIQIAVATLAGAALAQLWGWALMPAVVFGLSLSVASTVVLLRGLEQHRLLDTEGGRIAVGWLVVEDLVMVLALVVLPVMANEAADGDWSGIFTDLALVAAKIVGFVALMLVGGRRFLPWMLGRIEATGSRELFTLAVLAAALGVAYAASHLFGISVALGAFLAGVVLSGSRLSQEAGEKTLPLQDAFAVLFFVAVGMLFDPAVLVTAPLKVLAVLVVVIVVKSLVAVALVRLFGHPWRTALTIAAGLAQVGEFSFILAGLAVSLGLLSGEGRDLILAAALFSISLNPLLFALQRRSAVP